MLNKYHLRGLYTSNFIHTINYYAKSLHEKILPAFGDIAEEVHRYQEETANQLSCIDPADIAEQVFEAGGDFAIMADGVIQGIINMFTAGLHHLFEQQVLWLYRQELLYEWAFEVPPARLLNMKKAQKRLLRDYKIDMTVFKSWSTLEELRLVANVVKHADGPSCATLQQHRPDLFIHPVMRDDSALDDSTALIGPVYKPLCGEDIYVSPEEFTKYVEATTKFWEELEHAVGQLPD